ncbi:MAG: EAL domain-containing protein [Actinomycetota bacterium]
MAVSRPRRLVGGLRNRSLLTKFGLISLIAITLLGVTLGQMLRSSVERRAFDGAIAEAELVVRLGLQREISSNELRTGLSADRIRAIQMALRADFARIDVVDVVVWNLDDTVVFATSSTVVGEKATTTAELRGAAAGEPSVHIVDIGDDGDVSPVLRQHGKLVQVYQPIRFGSFERSDTDGVVRTSIPYGPVAETIRAETRRLFLVLVGALVVLYALLFRLVANASAELRRRADQNEHQARHDALTGLPNRMLFTEELDRRLDRGSSDPFAVVLIDLDRFKEVNDTLGHHIGDLLLVEVGRRLDKTMRDSDVVARLGGDEFALVLTEVDGPEAALHAAHRIVDAIEAPFEVEGLRLDVGASIGVAMAPQHGNDLVTLLQRADVAMYQAKDSGTSHALLYDPDDDHHNREQLALAGEFRRAIDTELVAFYQPKIDLATDRVCGVEALVRWDHPEHGLLSPDTFVPLAERGGLMNDLTRVVLDQSARQLCRWLDDGHDLHVAVNVSAAGLHDDELVAMVSRCLDRHGLATERLVLEITETTIAADPDRARQVLQVLRDQGVRISIDDFGTGYSSLAVLRSMPVNELKIDRQFVGDLGHPEGSAIVKYSAQLGHMLGLNVVAEGVEKDSDPPALLELGCDIAQGYWYARPMPGDDLTAWLTARAEVAAPSGTTTSNAQL